MPPNTLFIVLILFLPILSLANFQRRLRISCQLTCRRIQQTLVMGKEFFEGFCKVFLQMEAIHKLFRLGGTCISRSAKDLATISRNDLHFWMLFEPRGTRFHRTLWQEGSHPVMLEIHQDGPVTPTGCATR
jgi:hypothetical protein